MENKNAQKAIELLRCPFCSDGGKPEATYGQQPFPPVGLSQAKVYCMKCGATALLSVWQSRPISEDLGEAHAWYGPCDALGPDGLCSECFNMDKAVSDALLYFENNCQEPEGVPDYLNYNTHLKWLMRTARRYSLLSGKGE